MLERLDNYLDRPLGYDFWWTLSSAAKARNVIALGHQPRKCPFMIPSVEGAQ
jgi:hypothetical protein